MTEPGGMKSMLFHSRFIPLWLAVFAALLFGAGVASIHFTLWLAIPFAVAVVLVVVVLVVIGIHDLVQDNHSILRNYPISAHIRARACTSCTTH
jgi:hypothetical protein